MVSKQFDPKTIQVVPDTIFLGFSLSSKVPDTLFPVGVKEWTHTPDTPYGFKLKFLIFLFCLRLAS